MSDFSKTLAQLLRGVMREQNITVEQVAHKIGRSKAFVSHRTSGKASLDTDIIYAVAELADRDGGELLLELSRRMGFGTKG